MTSVTEMTEEQIAEHAARVRRIGYTVLERQLPVDAVATIAVAFEPIYQDHLEEIRTKPNRGPMRHYIQLPFEPPFYQNSIHGNDGIIAVVRRLIGDDADMVQFATDTPTQGSIFQDWHGDVPALFPEEPEHVPPPAIITVNFAMVDVNEENGPVEMADGTHLLPRPEALERIEMGEMPLRKLLLKVGDVLVRDPRCVHRGTPNTTDMPRPVAVFSFERAWYRLISLNHYNPVRRDFYKTLSELEQQVLKRIVEDESGSTTAGS